MRITNAAAESATKRARAYELHDDAGHALRVNPGGRKTWLVRYRTDAGQQRRLKLGTFPAMSAEQARREARRVLGLVEDGEDPAQQAPRRSAETVGDLCRWYLDEYAVEEGLAARTVQSDRYRLERNVIGRAPDASGRGGRPGQPWLAGKPVGSVTRRDIERLKKEMKDRPGGFRRLFTVLRVCFRHAEELGLRPRETNPCQSRTRQRRDGIKLPRERKMERFLSAEERARLEAVLASAETRRPHTRGYVASGYVLAIRLLAATGMRSGEVVDIARWRHVDWDHGFLALPDSKTGAKNVPLSTQALALLRAAYRGQAASERICVGEDGGALQNLQRVWRRVRKTAGLEDVRLHDLRHSWASDAIRTGVPLQVVGRVLGHASPMTTARYAHLADEYLRESVDRVGVAIERASRSRS